MYVYIYLYTCTCVHIYVCIYGMFSLVIFPIVSCLECSKAGLGQDPNEPPWALMGRVRVGTPGQILAGPLWPRLGPYGPGPCGPPWAHKGRALMGAPARLWARASLVPHGPGPCGPLWPPLWARPLWAPTGPLWAEPFWAPHGPCGPSHCGPPWAIMGRALMGPLMQHSAKRLGNSPLHISFRSYR